MSDDECACSKISVSVLSHVFDVRSYDLLHSCLLQRTHQLQLSAHRINLCQTMGD